jgi:hypothetical protein
VKRGVGMGPQWILDFGIGSRIAGDENFFFQNPTRFCTRNRRGSTKYR